MGVGGMGMIYAAHDARLDRRVALKVLRPDLSSQNPDEVRRASARLVREAQMLARLAHPNVTAVHDVGATDDQVFIAMEFVEGMSLRAWLELEPRRPHDKILDVFLRAGRGLAAAHDAGIVHRDFKPENVLIGDDGRVRVTDFGLARSDGLPSRSLPRDTDVTPPQLSAARVTSARSGVMAGTPRYMAPEQLAGEGADARSDQFAFCVALYEALYQQHPFLNHDGSITAGVEPRPPPKGNQAPRWVWKVLLRGLQVVPAARHSSMAKVCALLQSHRARKRQWIKGFAATAMGGLLVYGFLFARGGVAGSLCAPGTEQFGEAWAPKVRDQAAAAFDAQGPEASAEWRRLEGELDDYAFRFSARFDKACGDAMGRSESQQTEGKARVSCLGRELDAFGG